MSNERQHQVAPVSARAAQERAYMEAGGRKTLINAVSGGVDSTLSALITHEAAPGRAFALLLPCSEEAERNADLVDGQRVADHVGMPAVTINLVDLWRQAIHLYTAAAQEMAAKSGVALDEARLTWAINNLKPTLRMSAAAFFADAFDGLTIGTGNAIEHFLGYFSIRGDAVSDRQPLRDLTKAEVRELTASGGFADDLVNRVPTAGLWEGQTDEQELGFSYTDADRFFVWLLDRHLEMDWLEPTLTIKAEAVEAILGDPSLPVSLAVAQKIVAQNRRTAFKRRPEDLALMLRRRGLRP